MPRTRNPAPDHVEGLNPVLEALRGPREVYEVYVASQSLEPSAQVRKVIDEAKRWGVPVKPVPRPRIDSMAKTSAPQGVIAAVEPYQYLDLAELLRSLKEIEAPLLLALDGVEDPHNLGSLLRVADAAGTDAVIMPGRRAAGMSAVVAKASAGAVEHVAIARVSSLAAAIDRLKAAGMWILGADASGGIAYQDVDMKVPLVIVLGGEGRGLSRLARERCDMLASLPMLGSVTSLNVSTAGAVLLYEAVRQRTGAE
jgi:23S rRNA (guanosine2251-2'-O)-methyltransferase